MRFMLSILFLIFICAALKCAAQTADADEVYRVESNLISVPVSVTDRNGKFAANLRREDFSLFDDGTEREIEYFESTEQPFSVLLLLDTSGSTAARLDDIKNSALAFIAQLKPQDRVLPVTFDLETKPLLKDWTNNQTLLSETIKNARMGADLKLAKREVEKRGGRQIVKYYVNTRLYDAVEYAFNACRQIRGRKAIILLSDGLDTGSENTTYKKTLRRAEESDALFYTIQYDRRSARQRVGVISAAQWDADEYLKSLAKKSGAVFQHASDMEKVNQSFAAIAEELRQTYTLGFYADDNSNDATKKRRIQVKLKIPKLVVRARKNYTFSR